MENHGDGTIIICKGLMSQYQKTQHVHTYKMDAGLG